MNVQTRIALDLYVEKADEIATSPFVSHLKEHGWGTNINFNFEESTLSVDRNYPDIHAINGIVTPLRFFVQRRDGIDFDSLPKTFGDPALSDHFRNEMAGAPDVYNDFMKRPMPGGIVINGHSLTRIEIFETFLYGHYAHANTPDGKRQKYVSWRKLPLFSMLELEFVTTLEWLLRLIAVCAQLCRKELEPLAAKTAE